MCRLKSKTVSVLASIGMLFVFIVGRFPLALATSLDSNSTVSSSGSSASVTPVAERVSSATTMVNPTTSKVEPLQVAATPADSYAPTLPWTYILMAGSFIAIIIAAFILRRRGHKLSRLRLLSSLTLLGLLVISVAQVYGEEDMAFSNWDLTTVTTRPMVIRESVDSGGNVWFGSLDYAYKIGYLNPSTNEIKTWLIPESNYALTVSVDATNKVWFASYSGIGRLDPSTNFFTIWPVDGIGYYSNYEALPTISLDSYGNAYFPECSTNEIGRLNPTSNELTEWTIPTMPFNTRPCYTMVDFDGNVWFAEYDGNKIGRLNPYTNEFAEWAIPTPNSRPSGLYVAGGQVYFAEYQGRKIGRLNPATNELTQWSLSLPGVSATPVGLFVDSEGNVWSIGKSGYLFGLAPDNTITYWCFALGYAFGITIDTKTNIGDIYSATHSTGGKPAILRFHLITP